MILKSHYALCYTNRAVLWLKGTSVVRSQRSYRWIRRWVFIRCQ